MEVEHPRLCSGRRPARILPPHVRSCLEHIGLWRSLALALQVVLEERELYLLAEELAGLCIERDVAEMIAIAARPAAMDPWALDNRIGRARVPLLDGTIGAPWTAQILRV